MKTTIGDFGADHGWWGRPEYQDAVPRSAAVRPGPLFRGWEETPADRFPRGLRL